MADIEFVVKMSEETVNEIKDNAMFAYSISSDIRWDVTNAIVNGIVLPKGHGDLIDRKALMDNGYQMEPVEMWYGIKYAPTIIGADKEDKA